MKKFHILFICSGNICRSPLAEGLLRTRIPKELQPHVVVESAGTLFIRNIPPDPLAILAGKRAGVDISDHRSQGASRELLNRANIIFVMAISHFEYIKHVDSQFAAKTFLLKKYDRNWKDLALFKSIEITDPIGGELDEFMQCKTDIELELNRIWPTLKEKIEIYLKEQAQNR